MNGGKQFPNSQVTIPPMVGYIRVILVGQRLDHPLFLLIGSILAWVIGVRHQINQRVVYVYHQQGKQCHYLYHPQMPARKVKGGWRWGTKGKVYKTRQEAIQQGIAIRMNKKRKG